MTQKHTPGPWRYDPQTSMVQAPSDWTDEGGKRHHDFHYPRVIANVADDWDARTHGALIAAAPELLAEAEANARFLDQLAAHLDANDMPGQAGNCTIRAKATRAAIAKAEGRA